MTEIIVFLKGPKYSGKDAGAAGLKEVGWSVYKFAHYLKVATHVFFRPDSSYLFDMQEVEEKGMKVPQALLERKPEEEGEGARRAARFMLQGPKVAMRLFGLKKEEDFTYAKSSKIYLGYQAPVTYNYMARSIHLFFRKSD